MNHAIDFWVLCVAILVTIRSKKITDEILEPHRVGGGAAWVPVMMVHATGQFLGPRV